MSPPKKGLKRAHRHKIKNSLDVANLPFEILSEVFLFVFELYDENDFEANYLRVALLSTSRLWRNVCIQTSGIWDNIYIE